MPSSVVVVDAPPSAPRQRSEAEGAPPSVARGASADSDNQHSATFTVTSGSERGERIVHVYPDRIERTSSGGSRSAHTSASSSSTHSFPSEDSWSELDYEEEHEDGIDPSDSASRSRRHPSRRHTVEARAAPPRPIASRRAVERGDEVPSHRHPPRSRHHSSRHDSQSRPSRSSSRRIPSDESSGTVASADDYPPYGRRGPPRAAYPPAGYRQPPQGHGAYPPSMASASAYHDPYASQAIMRTQHQDPFGYPQPNPFAPQGQQPNPFSPISAAEGSSYFATDPMAPPMPRHIRPDGPQRPQSYMAPPSHYGGEMVPAYPPYSQYGMPTYPPFPMAGWPPSRGSSPAAKDDRAADLEVIRQMIIKKDADEVARDQRAAEFDAIKQMIAKRDAEDVNKKKEDKISEIESLRQLIKKQDEESIARQKAWIAEREADAAAKAAEKAKAEEEKKRKQEIDDAKKKAKEDAEKKAEEAAKKAKEEADKKLAEAEKAKEEADKAKKELEEEIKKNAPEPDSLKPPIKFKDAVGRKFSFPWHLCKTWKGMEGLIKQAFLHVDVIGDHVRQGHYDLTGPDGEIILPQVWDTMVKPDTEITMHLWPMEEERKEEIDPFAGLAGMGMPPGPWDLPPEHHGKSGKKSKKDGKKKKGSPEAVFLDPRMPPPPPTHGIPPLPTGPYPDPFAGLGGFGPMPGEAKKDSKTKGRSKSKSSKEISPLAAWFAGGSVTTKPGRKK